MALPRIQEAQYGDRVALDKLAPSRQTNNPAVDVQGMVGNAGGRPPVTDPVELAMKAAQRGSAQAQPGPEQQRYAESFNALAVQYQTAVKWQRIASQPGAGPFTRWYAKQAISDFARNLMAVRGQTPFFDGV